ncbi:hypothetical protein T03_16857 [Trichinella britovi]|uniref:Uncharacterized protein n=1 Tax=Trichinella britovi TaxID=45882 RepID=A0A0V1BCN5_TRIBR|nr:hypothetical protein T03_16857 [Trichinella britovi]
MDWGKTGMEGRTIGNGVQTVIRWWTYIEQQCQEGTSLRMIVGWADWPFTTINALWDEWSAGLAVGFTTLCRRWMDREWDANCDYAVEVCWAGMQPRIGAGGVRRWHAAFMKQ